METLDLIKQAQSIHSGQRISAFNLLGFDAEASSTADDVSKLDPLDQIKKIHAGGGDRLVPMGGQLVKAADATSSNAEELALAKRAQVDDACPHCHKTVAATIIGERYFLGQPTVFKAQCGQCSGTWEMTKAA